MTHPLRSVASDVNEKRPTANYCSHCGQRLNTSAHVDSSPVPLASDLDALLQSTIAAKATFVFSAGEHGQERQSMNVTLLGVYRTLMGAPQSELLASSAKSNETLSRKNWAAECRQEKDLRQGMILIVSLALAALAVGLILIIDLLHK